MPFLLFGYSVFPITVEGMFGAPPVSVVTEWLEGVLAGSKLVYVYSPQGNKTRIDVYGDFTSRTLTPDDN